MQLQALKQALEWAIKGAGAPGATACVGVAGGEMLIEAAGYRALTPSRESAEKDSLYDLASLTKVIATTTAVMLLIEEGRLSLEQRITEFIPLSNLNAFTVRHLLTHTSGLPAWRAWHQEASGMLEYVEHIAEAAAGAVPDRSRTYSDMGFILLAKIVEQATRDSFDAFCRQRIFEPLGMKDTLFTPPEALRPRCAPTERCSWRNRMLRGEVHDENASAIGGVSGHAGLFSTARDLGVFCSALLEGRLVKEETLAEMTRGGQVPCYPWQGLGWWVDPWTSGANGYLPSRTAFGHTGWTGTSIWMDRDRKNYAILLSNTCHPTREKRNNGELRRRFYAAAADADYPNSTNAHTGLDKLLRNEFSDIAGKRLALLTNSAAVDQLGRSIMDVFNLCGAPKPSLLYSPEHGFFGQAEAGAHVASEKGDIPIVSLYGDRKHPSAEELRQIDLFAVDLPDIGARYYTYMDTMKNCMAACAEHNVPMLILDRPNPVGGAILEGPVAREYGSPVCCAPLPIRHGMTLGELALYFKDVFFSKTKLSVTVLSAENWWRELQADVCALPWKAPSPNIPSAETALMYIGTCLFEGLNMNEGRGTDTPFLVCGAPWLDAEAVLADLSAQDAPGCDLKPVLYIPKSIPGKAANPKHQDKLCRGIRFQIVDWQAARPFTTAAALIGAIHKRHDELAWAPFFDTLAGGPWLREQILSGQPAREIAAGLQAELAAFDAKRPQLYDSLSRRVSRT